MASAPNASRAEGIESAIAKALSSAENHPRRSAAAKHAREAPEAWLACSRSSTRAVEPPRSCSPKIARAYGAQALMRLAEAACLQLPEKRCLAK